MDVEEIEAWYEEKKAEITEKYMKKIKASRDKDKPKLMKRYKADLDSLYKNYEKRSEKAIGKNLKRYFFIHRLTMLKDRILKPYREYKDLHSKDKEEQ